MSELELAKNTTWNTMISFFRLKVAAINSFYLINSIYLITGEVLAIVINLELSFWLTKLIFAWFKLRKNIFKAMFISMSASRKIFSKCYDIYILFSI